MPEPTFEAERRVPERVLPSRSTRDRWDMALEDDLKALGFEPRGASRRGGRQWGLDFNAYLTFMLHDFVDHVVLTWSFRLGDYLLSKGWQVGAGETTFQELYPRNDVRLAAEIGPIEAEITRVLASLRLDLGAPNL